MPKNVKKWRFLAFLTIFSENAGKTRFFGVLGLKRPFLALLGLLAQGFYINPSGPLPRGRGALPEAWEAWGPGSPGTGEVRRPPGSRIPGSGSGEPLPPGRGALGGPGTGPGGLGEWGFTSTPRAGAPRFPGGVPGVRKSRRGPAGAPGDLPGGPGTTLPGRVPPPGTAGGGAPTGGEGRIPSSFRRKGVRSRPVPVGASPRTVR